MEARAKQLCHGACAGKSRRPAVASFWNAQPFQKQTTGEKTGRQVAWQVTEEQVYLPSSSLVAERVSGIGNRRTMADKNRWHHRQVMVRWTGRQETEPGVTSSSLER